MREVVLIAYSGHAFVAYDALQSQGDAIVGYCDKEEKDLNPYALDYFGSETDASVIDILSEKDFFIAIGNNNIRQKVYRHLLTTTRKKPINAKHSSSNISPTAILGNGILVGANCCINAHSVLGDGVICNTASVIEHECKVGAFAHIAPNATLAGNVTIGERTFVGAGAVIIQGITIGNEVTIGAGAVIIEDVPDGATVVGNPGKIIKFKS